MELLRTGPRAGERARATRWSRPTSPSSPSSPSSAPHLAAMSAGAGRPAGTLRPAPSASRRRPTRAWGSSAGAKARRDRRRHAGGALIESLLAWVSQLPTAAIYTSSRCSPRSRTCSRRCRPTPRWRSARSSPIAVSPRRSRVFLVTWSRQPRRRRRRCTSPHGATAGGSSPRQTGRRLLAPRSLARHRARVPPLRHRRHLPQPVPARDPRRGPAVRRAGQPGRAANPGADGARLGDLVRRDHHCSARSSAPSGSGSSASSAGVNRTLGIIAGVARWRRAWLVLAASAAGGARERVWHATRDALDPAAPSFLAGTDDRRRLRPARRRRLLVLELAYADPALTPDRSGAGRRLICGSAGDSARSGRPPEPAPEDERRTRFAGYAARLRQRFGRGQRLELVERMWAVAFSDGGAIGRHEDRLMHLAAELLGVGPTEVAEVRRRLQRRARPMIAAPVREQIDRQFWLESFRDYLALESGPQREHGRGLPARLAPAGEFALVPRGRATRRAVTRAHPRNFVYLLKDLGLSAATIRREVSAIRTYYGFLLGEGPGRGRSERSAGDAAAGPGAARVLERAARSKRCCRPRCGRAARPGATGRCWSWATARGCGSPSSAGWRPTDLLLTGAAWCGSSARAARSGWCRSAASVIGAVSVYLHTLRPDAGSRAQRRQGAAERPG